MVPGRMCRGCKRLSRRYGNFYIHLSAGFPNSVFLHRQIRMDIPQDIIDNVIAAVGDDMRVLKKCTLVSSSFLLPSRKQLFSRITLKSDQTCLGIHQFLIQNPVIQCFVRSITLIGDIEDYDSRRTWINPEFPEWMNCKSLLAILRLPFSCLECFSIITRRNPLIRTSWEWNSFSSELKDALSNIIHSSTLKILVLTGIAKLPITFFRHIVHLRTLQLHVISPIDFCDENLSSLKEVAPMASHTVIDRCVWDLGLRKVWYEIPFICLFLNNLNSGMRPTSPLYPCHSCAVYAPLKSTLASLVTLISCPS
jgi:hypothetical protein